MDRISNALTAIKDAGSSGASSVGGFFSSSADSGVAAFKSTSLGESFFKNVGAIMITVLILLGGIIYIDLVSNPTAAGVGSSSPNTTTDVVQRTVHIEPNTGLDNAERVIPKDDGWTAPILSIRNELKEAFGTAYTELELEKIHTKCSDSFCVMHQKSPAELERACNSLTSRKMCGTKCCCGWTKYVGFEGDNDPTVMMNTAESNARDPSGKSDESTVPGKCVAGNSKRPYDIKDEQNQDRDIAYYYYLGECVGGRGCMKKGEVKV
jgi:hypothetical protein